MTPDIVFPALALFDLLSEPMLLIPRFIVQFIEASTSLSRIGDLLTLDELDDDQHGYVKRDTEPNANSSYSVIVKDATFIWSDEKKTEYKDEESEVQDTPSSNVALKDINFLAQKSKLTCVVGKVGSGKSTLIKAILGMFLLRLVHIQTMQLTDHHQAWRHSDPLPIVHKTHGS